MHVLGIVQGLGPPGWPMAHAKEQCCKVSITHHHQHDGLLNVSFPTWRRGVPSGGKRSMSSPRTGMGFLAVVNDVLWALRSGHGRLNCGSWPMPHPTASLFLCRVA